MTVPSRERLLSELTDDNATVNLRDETVRRYAIAELNQRLGDIAFELDLLPATFVALIRISLASGSALALLGFLVSTEQAPLERAYRVGFALAAGLFGAAAVSIVGRLAKARSAQIRQEWDRTSRDIGKALGTALADAEKVRDSGFPV